MESTFKGTRMSRAAIVIVVALALLAFALIELPIMNYGKVGLHRFNPSISILRILFYAAVLGATVFFHKRIEKYLIENQCLKKTKIFYFVILAVVLIGGCFTYLYRCRINHIHVYAIVGAALMVLFIAWAIGILFIGDKVENNFIAVGLSLLPLFSLFTKANHAVDEPSHFTEAYSVMMGHLFRLQYHGVCPPVLLNLNRDIPFYNFISFFQTHFNYHGAIPIDPNAPNLHPAGYPSVFYLPSAIGLLFGRALHFTVMAEYFSGRLANCLAFIILGYLAIRIMPVAKNIFSVVLLTPFLGLLSSTYSIDGIGTALIFLFAALCFYFAYNEKELSVRDYILLFVLACLVFIFKHQAYSPALLFLFFIPLKKLLKKDVFVKTFKIAFPIFMLLCVATAGFYLLHLPAQFSDSRGGNHVNASLQLRNIIAHPMYTASIYWKWVMGTLWSPAVFESMISNNYFFGTRCSIVIPIVVLWCFVAATDKSPEGICRGQVIKEKLLMSVDILITPLLVFFGIYLIFCNIGSPVVHGLQPRYLYPIVPFALLLMNSKKIKNSIRQYNSKIAFCSSLFLAVSLFEMVIIQ